MAVRTKTRRRLRLLSLVVTVVLVGGTAWYFVRQRQIAARILAGRAEGYAALDAGDYYTALHKIGPYLQRHREEAEPLFKYAQARQNVPEPNSKHIADAMGLYRRLLELQPDHDGARHQLLDLYVAYELNTEILEFTRDRQDPESHRARIIALKRLRRFDQALPLAEAYSQRFPLDLRQQMILQELLQQSGRPSTEIIARARTLQEAHPDDPRFELLLAFAYLGGNDQAAAVELARRAASRQMDDPELTEILVAQLDALGLFQESRSVLERALGNSQDQRFLIAVARRLLDARQERAVVQRLANLNLADNKVEADLLGMRALAHLRLAQRQEADTIIAALRDRKHDLAAQSWADVIETVFASSRPSDLLVIQACQQAVQNRPNEAYFHFYLGEAYLGAGDEPAALQHYLMAFQLSRSWADPLNSIARRMLSVGRPQEALDAARAAQSRAPDDPAVLITLAAATWSCSTEEDASAIQQVTRLLNRAEELSPADLEAPQLRIRLLAQLKKHDDAIAVIEQCLARDPAPDAEALLQLAAISRMHQLRQESKCYELYERKYGVTPRLALALALEAQAGGDPARGTALLEASRSRSDDPESREWRIVWASWLETIRDERAAAEWVALAEAEPQDAYVQRAALRAQSVSTDRPFQRRTIDRLGTIVGADGIEWRILEAQWLLSPDAVEADIVKAIVVLNDLARRMPDDIRCRRMLAESLARLDKPNEAIEQLMLAVRLAPGSNDLLIRLASLLHEVGDFDRAEPVIAQIRRNLDRARPGQISDDELRALAQLYVERGAADEAIHLLAARTAATTQPGSVDVQLALLQSQRGSLSDELCQRLLSSSDPVAIGIVADAYATRGATDEAKQLLARLDSMDLAPGVADMVRARYFERHGSPEQLQQQLESATKSAPRDARTWRALLTWHISRGNSAEFEQVLVRANQSVPGDPGIETLERHRAVVAQVLALESARMLAAAILDPEQDRATAVEAMQILGAASADAQRPAAQSLERLKPLAQRSPRLLPLQQLVATMHLSAGQPEPALEVAMRTMRLFPNEPEPARIAAQSLAVLARWEQLKPVAEQWRQRSPGGINTEADTLIAAAELASGNSAGALRTLQPHVPTARQLARTGDENLLRLYLQASCLAGRPQEAADVVKPLLANSAELRAVWIQVAGHAIADAKIAEAWLEAAEEAIDAGNVAERVMLAQAWLMLSQRSGLPAHQTAASLALEKASRRLHEAPRTGPQEWEALGMLYDAAGKPESAEAAYRQALALDANLPLAQNNLAMLLLSHGGDTNEALGLATRAASHRDHPFSAAFLDTLASVQGKLGRHDDAAATLRSAVERDPANISWRLHLAQVLCDSGQTEGARNVFAEIQQRWPAPNNLPPATSRKLEALRAQLQ